MPTRNQGLQTFVGSLDNFSRESLTTGASYFRLPGDSGKEYTCDAGDMGDMDLTPGSGRSCRWKWKPTSVFLPGKFHGQSSLVGCSPWGHKELDRTGRT